MKQFLNSFQNVRDDYDRKSARKTGLICITKVFEGCPGVQLHRESWMSGTAGVFFSVWTDAPGGAADKLHYNIHALKMRHLKFYNITSRKFAEDFREGFRKFGKSWPNVRVDYGPLNLMQGWIDLRPKTFESDTLRLLNQFAEICPLIDRLLQERIAPARRAR